MEYTTDIRDLDCLLLAKIGGAQYYEVHTIVREACGVRETIGRASDWPLIKERATNAELTALLTATIQHVSESEAHVARLSADLATSEEYRSDSECHVAELTQRQRVYEQHIAALEQAIAEWASPAEDTSERTELVETPIPPQIAELVERLQTPRADRDCDIDGKVACDYPGCDARLKPRGLLNHKRLAHQLRTTDVSPAPTPPTPPLSEIVLGEAPWRCAQCHTATHAQSIAHPLYCKKCVIAQADAHLSNGHQVAA